MSGPGEAPRRDEKARCKQDKRQAAGDREPDGTGRPDQAAPSVRASCWAGWKPPKSSCWFVGRVRAEKTFSWVVAR